MTIARRAPSHRRKVKVLAWLAAIVILASIMGPFRPVRSLAAGPCDVQLPLRAAFYYPWYPENWTQDGVFPASHYTPLFADYSLTAPVIQAHIAMLTYARIRAGISSWWGQGSPTDLRFRALLQASLGTGLCWTPYIESQGYGDPTPLQIDSDLTYIAQNYGLHPQFLRVGGRPAIFVYGKGSDSCASAARWQLANSGRFYLVLKVFPDYGSCSIQPDNWHQYAPSVSEDHQPGHSFSISPGFWFWGSSTPLLSRNTASWFASVRDMVASREPLQLITTFNEWMEGTAIEPAVGLPSFLDALNVVN